MALVVRALDGTRRLAQRSRLSVGLVPLARSPFVVALIALALVAGCKRKGEAPAFELLSPNETGVTFANTITTDDSLNVQTDVYVYNGAGVGVGDIDNDGLPDIFFAGNMVSSRLYLNKGHMRFEDITKQAGVTTNRWATGVTMVDINDDGYLDIYHQWFIAAMVQRGYCGWWDSEEVQVKKENRFSEHYKIFLSDGRVRRVDGGAYRSTCWPAAF